MAEILINMSSFQVSLFINEVITGDSLKGDTFNSSCDTDAGVTMPGTMSNSESMVTKGHGP